MKQTGIKWLLFLFLAASITAPACRAKYGCEAQESLRPKVNKKGEIVSKKKKQDGLFPKKMSKKMKH
jgi:hypothetical protein